MEEIWCPINGYELSYEISNLGRVRALDRVIITKDDQRRFRKGRLIKLRPWNNKYHCVILHKNNLGKVRTIHSLVAEHFIGERPQGKDVCHNDGNYINNIVTNLYYGTKSQNGYDSVEHGTHFNASKIECPLGHELIEPNLMMSNKGQGGRACLACSRGRATVSNNKKRGIEKELKLEADMHYRRIMKT